ncbi:flagellar biosynthesis anti-sigma factor FlgM [Variovorax sp. J22P271]|uniref:flagellar biosynthesis anti-sigma factor FlgM n=1 Tax=Variovorax davisae TaxID=3053515 RepID=UPI0025785023|nr:flagellar biosynthesis anti-sigma factor FlgM [Variovorax sp. J22P271]MDM0031949.1 flagellar biosynthesis anti-sigma factor FlgM [Variovorax sp. J22P271]
MKIDPSGLPATPLSRPTKAGAAAGSGVDGAAAPATDGAQAMGQVRTLPGTSGGDFDAARVAAIREDIRAGRYEVHPDRIASGLLASVRDLLDPEAQP